MWIWVACLVLAQDASTGDATQTELLAQAPSAIEPAPTEIVPGFTWATAGVEHELFACRDLNADGFDEIVVMSPQRTLLASDSVQGFKAAPWRAIDASSWPGGLDGFLVAAGTSFASTRLPSPPPYEPEAKLLRVFSGDLDGDKALDTIAIHRCTRPHDFLELRVAFAPRTSGDDGDGDGLPNSQEIAIGTDARDRDSDDDGLLDGWEVLGFPRELGLDANLALDPRRQDVLIAVAPYEGIDVTALKAELERAAQLYRNVPTENRDGSDGIWPHFRIDPAIPVDKQHGGDWSATGSALFPKLQRGFMHWMQVTPGGGGQAQQTGDMGGCGVGFAVFAHEFGHQLGLGHEGDSRPAWCPLYPSLMNYAFSYAFGGDGNAVHFSSGRFRQVELRERALLEKLPFPVADLQYLAAAPFRFTLRANGEGETLIDWNQNGVFDEREVSADINYGSSTHCGTRRIQSLIGSAPSLAYAMNTAHVAALDTIQSAVLIRSYLGNEQWSPPRALPTSSTNFDPLLVGTDRAGFVFMRGPQGWSVVRFDAAISSAPQLLAELPNAELGAANLGERVLLVARRDDDSLSTHWFESDEQGSRVRLGQDLELRSKVAVGIGLEPKSGRIVLASAMGNSKGAPLALRISWYRVSGDRLVEDEMKWVRGESSGTQCSTRPTVLFDSDGQLDIFHTAIPDANGLMSMWRTRRVGNLALDEGWLTSQLYDVWTLTRRALSAVTGPQGALFAFRWDAGDVYEWRNTQLVLAHDAFGIDPEPMRDFDDGEKMARYGLAHSILWMQPDSAQAQ